MGCRGVVTGEAAGEASFGTNKHTQALPFWDTGAGSHQMRQIGLEACSRSAQVLRNSEETEIKQFEHAYNPVNNIASHD